MQMSSSAATVRPSTALELAKKSYVPAHWGEATPKLHYLWGTGILMMGVLLLLGW